MADLTECGRRLPCARTGHGARGRRGAGRCRAGSRSRPRRAPGGRAHEGAETALSLARGHRRADSPSAAHLRAAPVPLAWRGEPQAQRGLRPPRQQSAPSCPARSGLIGSMTITGRRTAIPQPLAMSVGCLERRRHQAPAHFAPQNSTNERSENCNHSAVAHSFTEIGKPIKCSRFQAPRDAATLTNTVCASISINLDAASRKVARAISGSALTQRTARTGRGIPAGLQIRSVPAHPADPCLWRDPRGPNPVQGETVALALSIMAASAFANGSVATPSGYHEGRAALPPQPRAGLKAGVSAPHIR